MAPLTPQIKKEIVEAAEDLYDRIRELRSPKDAAMAVLIAHVKMTLGEDMDRERVDHMLKEYSAAFRESYFG